MKQWPTREAEADYKRARELLGWWWPSCSDYATTSRHYHRQQQTTTTPSSCSRRRSGLGGLLLLRSLAADGRHPAASWDLHACRLQSRASERSARREGGEEEEEEEGAVIDREAAMEAYRWHAAQEDHPIAHYLIHLLTGAPGYDLHLQRAADLGYPPALKSLAVCYDDGLGVGLDLMQAVRLYERAVEQGDIDAQYQMGVSFLRGCDETGQLLGALGMLEKAVEMGQPQAMTRMGHFYRTGPQGFAARWRVGPDRDMSKAAELYERAAGLGDPEAMIHLANAHMQGEGVVQDVRRAFQLYCAAGLLGDESALVRILNLHQFSIDQSGQRLYVLVDDEDLMQAFECYRLCARSGSLASRQLLKHLLDTNFVDETPYATEASASDDAGSAIGHTTPASLFHCCLVQVNRMIEADILAQTGRERETPSPLERQVMTRVPCDTRERMAGQTDMRPCDMPGCERQFLGEGVIQRVYRLKSSSSSLPPSSAPSLSEFRARLCFCSRGCWLQFTARRTVRRPPADLEVDD